MTLSLACMCIVEFVGTLLFQLVGGDADIGAYNGMILAVVIYMTAHASGGVVNPAVSTCLLAVGEMPVAKWAAYVASQLLGAVAGSLIARIADPTAHSLGWAIDGVGHGCVPLSASESQQFLPIFIWEFIGTFMLCATVLTTAVDTPGFGDLAPFAIGLAVAVNVDTSGSITGGCYNPARFFGPALAFGCRLQLIWLYFSAELLGGLAAALWHTKLLGGVRRQSTPMLREHARSGADGVELSVPTS